MIARRLSALLKGIPETNYRETVSLIRYQKIVFDRTGLGINAIECIDRAISDAESLVVAGKDPEAWNRILRSYDMFTTVLNAVERNNYWSSERVTGIPDPFKHRWEGPPVEANTQELKAIRRVFDTYVKAALLLRIMPDYAQNLGLTPKNSKQKN